MGLPPFLLSFFDDREAVQGGKSDLKRYRGIEPNCVLLPVSRRLSSDACQYLAFFCLSVYTWLNRLQSDTRSQRAWNVYHVSFAFSSHSIYFGILHQFLAASLYKNEKNCV